MKKFLAPASWQARKNMSPEEKANVAFIVGLTTHTKH
jgi:hypothetical protein